ncbi:MAG: hypothetical protein ACRC8S_08750 [Fimbriiglobus sp.]
MNAKLVRMVAYFRALGQSWDQIAVGLQVSALMLEGLPVTHPTFWQLANEEFEPVILRDTKFQAIASLKLQMRSTHEAINQNATLAFLKYDMESKKLVVKQQQLKLQEEKARLRAEELAAAKAALPPEPAENLTQTVEATDTDASPVDETTSEEIPTPPASPAVATSPTPTPTPTRSPMFSEKPKIT